MNFPPRNTPIQFEKTENNDQYTFIPQHKAILTKKICGDSDLRSKQKR